MYAWPAPEPAQRMPIHTSSPILPEPNACAHCHLPERAHSRQWTDNARWHRWTVPSDPQRLRRMLDRRAVRLGEFGGVITHHARWACPKADRESRIRREQLRAGWYLMRSLVMAIAAVAERCPHLASGHARARLLVDPYAFTVDHRPVALRTLVVACARCPTGATN